MILFSCRPFFSKLIADTVILPTHSLGRAYRAFLQVYYDLISRSELVRQSVLISFFILFCSHTGKQTETLIIISAPIVYVCLHTVIQHSRLPKLSN